MQDNFLFKQTQKLHFCEHPYSLLTIIRKLFRTETDIHSDIFMSLLVAETIKIKQVLSNNSGSQLIHNHMSES